jgi:hypothetical protein
MAKYRLLSSRNLYRTPLAGVVRAADAALVERRAVFATARLWSTLSSRWTYATTSSRVAGRKSLTLRLRFRAAHHRLLSSAIPSGNSWTSPSSSGEASMSMNMIWPSEADLK